VCSQKYKRDDTSFLITTKILTKDGDADLRSNLLMEEQACVREEDEEEEEAAQIRL
jgi:hypothetical protein